MKTLCSTFNGACEAFQEMGINMPTIDALRKMTDVQIEETFLNQVTEKAKQVMVQNADQDLTKSAYCKVDKEEVQDDVEAEDDAEGEILPIKAKDAELMN